MPPLKFAVVREDPALEARLVERTQARAVLLVASGGCTALSLAHRFPALEVVAFDANPAQLAHVRAKNEALALPERRPFNVEAADPGGLNQRGEFEKLFRLLQRAVRELVAGEAGVERFFAPGTAPADRAAEVDRWCASPYWPAVFDVAFAEGLLLAMFGPAATQHAAPGSYPAYFRGVFERGLRRPDAARNPFLQHVLLGRYLAADAPGYLSARRPLALELFEGTLTDVPALHRFDVISLSNILDWSDDALAARWAAHLASATRPGCAVLLRQLNNRRDLRRFFEPAFRFDDALGAAFLDADRSLFYDRFEIGFRGAGS